MKKLLLICFLLIAAPELKAQYFDTISIHYTIGDATIDQKAAKTLDSLLTFAGERKLLIYSYADYLGTEKPNYHLSEARAIGVKKYLLSKGLAEEQILQCTGLGQLATNQKGNTGGDYQSRRSDIFIRREKPLPQQHKTGTHNLENQSLPKPSSGVKITDDLLALEVDQTLRMDNIGFYPGRATVLPSAYQDLDDLYNTLADNPTLKVCLEGHVCCCVYPDGFFEDTPTWSLSVERALTIYRHLIKRGIAKERLQYKGFGRTKPIRDKEQTSAEGQINRRVEVRVLEK